MKGEWFISVVVQTRGYGATLGCMSATSLDPA